jgi:peptidoglycan hydrolase-like protein with peptidoglycan-binding domain
MALGYPLPKHGADGIRGPETKAAVSKFQSDNNLTVDGDPGPETVGKLNDILKSKPEVAKKITKSTAADVKAVDYTKGAADLDALASDDSVKEAKLSAEKFLGRDIDDKEWNYLIRATSSEASNNSEEQANVMGVILNRARSGKWGNSIISVLRAPNQFQAVTGTRFDPNPSANFTRGPTRGQLANIVQGATKTLPNVPKDIMNFTSNVDAAYGAGTNIGFKSKLAAAPNSYVVGQTVFGTV